MSLKEHFEELGVDGVTGDMEFIFAEHDALGDYCRRRCFRMSDKDMSEIHSRGLYDDYATMRNAYILSLWKDYEEARGSDGTLAGSWGCFEPGTGAEPVSRWFESEFAIRAEYLAQGACVPM